MGARSRGRFNRGPSPPDLAVAVWGTCLGLYESVSGFLALPSRGIEESLCTQVSGFVALSYSPQTLTT